MTTIPSPVPTVTAVFHAVAAALADLRRRRARRQALIDLLAFEPHRLDDLGVCRADVIDALEQGTRRQRQPEPGKGARLRIGVARTA